MTTVTYILSANLARRHMSKGQRAMAAAKVSVLSTTQGARLVGTTQAYVSRARQVLEADQALADQVLAGTIPQRITFGFLLLVTWGNGG